MRVIWLNGAFGAGKTTVAERLIKDDPQLLLFDAELPGFMFREIVPLPSSGDFQDLRVWRRGVVDTAVSLLEEYGRTLVIPMTVVVPEYLDEIFSGLRARDVHVDHYFLDVPASVLRKRCEAQSIWPNDPSVTPRFVHGGWNRLIAVSLRQARCRLERPSSMATCRWVSWRHWSLGQQAESGIWLLSKIAVPPRSTHDSAQLPTRSASEPAGPPSFMAAVIYRL
ncbi:hypothetical protein Jiend_50080 [Micromonospora endophytica]|uniref:AAA family ATPase n=1 Tax=Micromonospora endophytica TaxID=515350 RepID=UPI001BB3C9AD|nr:AAA family ATPase [Micromonospora endophytica]BCJ61586.1 hypothetical protein Jiend_50080 [Micromonospora endophytica]